MVSDEPDYAAADAQLRAGLRTLSSAMAATTQPVGWVRLAELKKIVDEAFAMLGEIENRRARWN